MITQIVLDWLASIVAGFINSLPALPAEYFTVQSAVASAIDVITPYASTFGVVVPWGTLAVIVPILLTLIPIWLTVLPIRVTLWALGR